MTSQLHGADLEIGQDTRTEATPPLASWMASAAAPDVGGSHGDEVRRYLLEPGVRAISPSPLPGSSHRRGRRRRSPTWATVLTVAEVRAGPPDPSSWWRVEAAVKALFGRGAGALAGRGTRGVGDRERGKQPARGARHSRDERRGPETGGKRRSTAAVCLLPGRTRQPDASDSLRRGAALLDYSQGGNRAYDIARILRDYLVRVEPGSDDLLLGKAFFVVAGTRLAQSYFLIERYRILADAEALANR